MRLRIPLTLNLLGFEIAWTDMYSFPFEIMQIALFVACYLAAPCVTVELGMDSTSLIGFELSGNSKHETTKGRLLGHGGLEDDKIFQKSMTKIADVTEPRIGLARDNLHLPVFTDSVKGKQASLTWMLEDLDQISQMAPIIKKNNPLIAMEFLTQELRNIDKLVFLHLHHWLSELEKIGFTTVIHYSINLPKFLTNGEILGKTDYGKENDFFKLEALYYRKYHTKRNVKGFSIELEPTNPSQLESRQSELLDATKCQPKLNKKLKRILQGSQMGKKEATKELFKHFSDALSLLSSVVESDERFLWERVIFETIYTLYKHQLINFEDISSFFEDGLNIKYAATYLHNQYLYSIKDPLENGFHWHPIKSVFKHENSSALNIMFQALGSSQKKRLEFYLLYCEYMEYDKLSLRGKGKPGTIGYFTSEIAKNFDSDWAIYIFHQNNMYAKPSRLRQETLDIVRSNIEEGFEFFTKSETGLFGEGSVELILLYKLFEFLHNWDKLPDEYRKNPEYMKRFNSLSLSTQYLSEMYDIFAHSHFSRNSVWYESFLQQEDDPKEKIRGLESLWKSIKSMKSEHDEIVCNIIQVDSINSYFLNQYIEKNIESLHRRITNAQNMFKYKAFPLTYWWDSMGNGLKKYGVDFSDSIQDKSGSSENDRHLSTQNDSYGFNQNNIQIKLKRD